MEASLAPGARLVGAAAVVAATGLVMFTPHGPWQPLSVLLGALAVVAVAIGVVSGRPGWLAGAVVILLVRVGVHGLAGELTPGLAPTAFGLVLMVELAAVSLEIRVMPRRVSLAVVRSVILAAGAAVGVEVVLLSGLVGDGDGNQLWGLAAAGLVGLMVVAVGRGYVASRDGISQSR